MSDILETTALSSQDLIALEERHGAHNYHPLEIVITRGEGVWVWDVEGNRYLDFLAAYSAVNQGHCHPRLVKALTEQAQRLTLCSRAFRNDQLGQLCQEISALTGFDRFLPMNSGAEAVETAIKLARKWGQTVKGVPAARGRDPGLRQQLPRPHHDDRRLLLERPVPRRLRPVRRRLPPAAVRGCRRRRGGDERAHGRRPRRADPGRGRNRHSAGRASCSGSASITAEAQRAAHRGRDPVRTRPHRRALRLPARRHPPRHGDRRARRSRAASTRSRESSPTAR